MFVESEKCPGKKPMLKGSIKMRPFIQVILISLILRNYYLCYDGFYDHPMPKWPTVAISVLVRNQAHTLPYFLSCIGRLDYPKDRIFIWIFSDYNTDNSSAILQEWAENHSHEYNNMYIYTDTPESYQNEMEISSNWTEEHFKHVVELRQKALDFAKKKWADFIFMIDADVYLTEPMTLQLLVNKDLTVVAPMLFSEGLYSNFWCAMTENYYYKRTEEYKVILSRELPGCYQVPMVHTAVLIGLRHEESEFLVYDPEQLPDYNGPYDDIIAFAVSAQMSKIPLFVCNDETYGYVQVPLLEGGHPEDDLEQLRNIKVEAIGDGNPIPLDPELAVHAQFPKPSKYGCDQMYMINLKRRKQRRELMKMSFKELGMDVELFEAVDGKDLNMNNLRNMSIKILPNYEDPFHKRPMKAGEVGCFLSHYSIWREVVSKGYNITLVLEDDIDFIPYFRAHFQQLMEELIEMEWDLVYIGRKIMLDNEEQQVTAHTVRPLYSYWTLGYLLSATGARKLLDADPLSKMLPVDEFLPIMFDQHPNETWKAYFPVRNLIAYSASPLLVHPTHYTGQPGYVSDTEDSSVLEDGRRAKREL